MKRLDGLTRFATVRLLIEAANEELHPTGAAALVEPVPRPVGWDPFEVWRTRVRDPRRGSGRPPES